MHISSQIDQFYLVLAKICSLKFKSWHLIWSEYVNIVAKKVSHISEENFHNKQSWSANTWTEKTTVLHFEMVSATFENYTCLQNSHPQIPIHTGR